jgi:hypothetical protein
MLLAAGLAAGCGGGPPPEAARPVPERLVPAELLSSEVKVVPSESADAAKALSNLPKKALVSSAKLWELRRGEELIGALQVSTLKAKVDLHDDRERNQIVKGVLAGTIRTAQVGDVLILSARSPDKKSVYFWFREDLRVYEVLQLKTGKLDHRVLVEELVAYQRAHAGDPA